MSDTLKNIKDNLYDVDLPQISVLDSVNVTLANNLSVNKSRDRNVAMKEKEKELNDIKNIQDIEKRKEKNTQLKRKPSYSLL